MASAQKKNDGRKSHDRLESFLKRVLDFDTYERIRAHESCIVCSEKENKAFRFVVLCDSWIYLIDNDPAKLSIKNPRTSANDVQKLLSKVIHLQDIVSLSQVFLLIFINTILVIILLSLYQCLIDVADKWQTCCV